MTRSQDPGTHNDPNVLGDRTLGSKPFNNLIRAWNPELKMVLNYMLSNTPKLDQIKSKSDQNRLKLIILGQIT